MPSWIVNIFGSAYAMKWLTGQAEIIHLMAGRRRPTHPGANVQVRRPMAQHSRRADAQCDGTAQSRLQTPERSANHRQIVFPGERGCSATSPVGSARTIIRSSAVDGSGAAWNLATPGADAQERAAGKETVRKSPLDAPGTGHCARHHRVHQLSITKVGKTYRGDAARRPGDVCSAD